MELETLLKKLNANKPSRWRDAALSTLKKEPLSFAGGPDSRATATASELVQTYRGRLEHIRRRGINAIGIEELLEALSRKAPGVQLRVVPFLGQQSSVYAFWDEEEGLIGCVTVSGNGRDTGETALNTAMGKLP